MDAVRYFLAVLLMVSFPSAVMIWFIIHPFVEFWRRRGMSVAYTVAIGLMILVGVLAYNFRGSLLGYDWGTNWWWFALGLVLYVIAGVMERLLRQHLKFRILVGVPELKDENNNLLDQGMYRLVRHPRYLSIMIAMAGFALITNFSGMYVLAAISVLALLLVANVEERELVRRFGQPYRDYMNRVPQLIPTQSSFQAAFGKSR